MADGFIHSTESFGAADGPGIRFLVFLSGCPYRCQYCHNPDTWARQGTPMSSDALLAKALRNKPYWSDQGGITVSGGEPLGQIDFLLDFFQKAKKEGVHTCIDTAGGPFTREGPWFAKFGQLMAVTDLLLVDIKHIDEQKHIALTGKSAQNEQAMLRCLSEIRKPIWIRHVLVPGICDNDEDLLRTRDFIRTLGNVQRIEVLPYHTMGEFKWKQLNLPYPLEGVKPPTAESVKRAQELLEVERYTGWKN